MTCDIWIGKVNFGLSFHVLSISTPSKCWILHCIFFHRFQTIFDWAIFRDWNYKSNRTLNRLDFVSYKSSRDRLLSRYSSQLLFGIGGKNLWVCLNQGKYCLLYSSREILQSIAQPEFVYANDKWRHDRKCLFIFVPSLIWNREFESTETGAITQRISNS